MMLWIGEDRFTSAIASINGRLDSVVRQLADVKRSLTAIDVRDRRIEGKEDIIMSVAEDLNNGVTALATGFGALSIAVHNEISALAAAIANTGDAQAVKDAAIQATSNISAIVSKMAADAAELTNSIPGATTVQAPPAAPPSPVPPTVEPPVIATPDVTAPAGKPPNEPPPAATTPSPDTA